MFIHSHGEAKAGSAPLIYRLGFVVAILCCFAALASNRALGQATTFAGNAQHTSSYAAPAQSLNRIKWVTSVDLNNTGVLIHYGAPLVTAGNTVLVPTKIGATDGFRIGALNGATGASKYTLTTDYVLPVHNWIPSYNPCVATGAFGTRLYYAGAGGTIWHVDNPDSNTPGVPVREVFYTSLSNYGANSTAYNNTIFINTPLTADASGNIYFGFRVQGTAPAPLSTTQGGFARIDVNGSGKYVLASAAASDGLISQLSHNVAPALSNDGSTVYTVVKWSTDAKYGYLLGLDSTTLSTKYSVFLRDPRNANPAEILDDSTSSPMIAPDGDVYFGIRANPRNGSRGFLLRFSGDLSITKTPGAFGWDYTPGIVPSSSVPSYTGNSPYLLFCKYNDYFASDGSGVNRVALLDPNDTQIDPHPTAVGLIEMREVLTVIGPTPDPDVNAPNAVKEWCINAPAVNPATNSVFFNSEDGHAYRWNLATNSLDQAIILNQGIGQPYVPTVIGPDGTVYTLNGGTLFALGSISEVMVTIASSSPDLRTNVAGSNITFTATVTGSTPPTGTVTFFGVTYNGLNPETTTLASNIPLNASGQAAVSTSSLAAGGTYLGNHFVTALYNGDANHASTFATLMQKVHANSTITVLDVSPNPSGPGQPVTLTATVSGVPSGVQEVPTGMITFFDGAIIIGQVPLDPDVGIASIMKSNFSNGGHTITVTYASDTQFAASSDSKPLLVNPPIVQLSASAFGVTEGTNTLTVQVTRVGNSSGVSTVDYATSDTAGANNCNVIGHVASSRCDYITTLGTLSFAAGEVSKTIAIPIVDDVYAEGNESFTIALSNPTGAVLGQGAATLTIADNETVNGARNPIDEAEFFVRQHYVDFLNREPDADGLAFWKNQITQCGSDAACIELKRINVSAAFFLAIEFQETGYLAYRVYKSAFGNLTNPAGAPVPVRFADFLRDTQQIGQGVQVGIGNWQQQLETNKQAYALAFVQRPDFLAAFPSSLSGDQFVTQLDNRAGGVLSAPEKANLVAVLGATPADVTKRASVLRSVAEDQDLKNAEKNRAFVLMQYFGYLRRNPYDPPELGLDFTGYNFWLGKLNQFNGNFVNAEMVKSFLVSAEYRQRFAP